MTKFLLDILYNLMLLLLNMYQLHIFYNLMLLQKNNILLHSLYKKTDQYFRLIWS